MTEKQKTSERIYIIDYLKVLAIFMVIFTHYEWEDKTTPFFTLVIAMAVPIFMIVTGYNMSMSCHTKTAGTLRVLYTTDWLLPRLSNLLFPFLLVYPLEMLLHVIIFKETFSIYDLIRYFFRGGLGPGSYYIPVIITLLFLFPLIFTTVKRHSFRGVAFIGLIQLIYEIYVPLADVTLDQYRLTVIRYLIYVALGSYLYFYFEDKKKYPIIPWVLIPMFLCGLTFSVAVYQFNWNPPIFQFWTRTSLPVALYIFPIIYGLMLYLRDYCIPEKWNGFFIKISQSTYHIFLVQMIYYRLFDHMLFPNGPAVFVVSINIIICMTLGYGFFWLHTKLKKHKVKSTEQS